MTSRFETITVHLKFFAPERKEGKAMHFYITGDTHGNFSRIAAFCRERHTTK